MPQHRALRIAEFAESQIGRENYRKVIVEFVLKELVELQVEVERGCIKAITSAMRVSGPVTPPPPRSSRHLKRIPQKDKPPNAAGFPHTGPYRRLRVDGVLIAALVASALVNVPNAVSSVVELVDLVHADHDMIGMI
jgi:hypothetical protein